MSRLQPACLAFGLALALPACGGEDPDPGTGDASCTTFCTELGCPDESAACDSSSECACFGCDAFYAVYYTNENPGGGPACTP